MLLLMALVVPEVLERVVPDSGVVGGWMKGNKVSAGQMYSFASYDLRISLVRKCT